ncbi:hypothetical protein GGR51DRAFT_576338 [Nemania sp. FL0031]|nr:hypothetical protein GGR51DRAFT_576338 [Nemania sp. FL0031]
MDLTVTDANTQRELQKYIELARKYPESWVKPAIDWIFEEPQGDKHGRHPEWPGYTGIGKSLKFRPEPLAYEAKTLAENTILSFYPAEGDRNLTPMQIKARKEIIRRFTEVQFSPKPITTCDIEPFMSLFDKFFFFGAMTSRRHPRVVCTLWEKQSPHLLRHWAPSLLNQEGLSGFTRHRHIKGYGPVSDIHIKGPSVCDPETKLGWFLCTLLHEMVHAYLRIYVCPCTTCKCNIINASGVTGHGPSFLMILDVIDRTLQDWGIPVRGMVACEYVREGTLYNWDDIAKYRHLEARVAERHYRWLDGPPEECPCRRPVPQTEGSSVPDGGTSRGQPDEAKQKKKKRVWERRLNIIRKINDPKKPKICMCINRMRPIHAEELGGNVYMAVAQVGGTVVDQAKLAETCDIVQGLIKAEGQRRFRWPGTSIKDLDPSIEAEKDAFKAKKDAVLSAEVADDYAYMVANVPGFAPNST